MKDDPSIFLNSSRFDILAKYIYAKLSDKKRETDYGKDIYYNHLKVWNDCRHGDGKNNFNEYLESFDELLASIKKEGFDAKKSKVNTTPDHRLLNGGHRVASCLLHDKKIEYEYGGIGQSDVDYNYFLNKDDFVSTGLERKYCDSIAIEYCKIKPSTFIVTIFPSAHGNLDKVEQILSTHGDIFYKKDVSLSSRGALNLMRQMYEGEEWAGDYSNNYAGFREKASLCFQGEGPLKDRVYAYVVSFKDPNEIPKIKKEIRDIFKIGNHSVHINDTWPETMKLAKAFFNHNSIYYMNTVEPSYYKDFEQACNYLGDCVSAHLLDADDYCVTGSAVLSRLGIREGKDLDYLHRAPEIRGHPLLDTHNEYSQGRYTLTIDDIIYNPDNHFYFNGIKYADLRVIIKLKEKRGEEKDKKDLELIEKFLYEGQF